MIIKAYVMYDQYISNYVLIYANMPAFALLDYTFFSMPKACEPPALMYLQALFIFK
mgnify:CR=1 FL=1